MFETGLATPTVSANILFPLLRGGMSAVDDDHFPVGLVGLHDAMSLTDFVEAKDPRRLGVEPASRNVLGDFLKRDVREREARCAEHEAAEEGQIDAARHLQERVEVGDGIEATEPSGKAGTAAAAKHGEGIEHDAVADQIEHGIDLLRLGVCFDKSRRSISQRSAPSFSSIEKRSGLRVAAITRAPALTAILSAA
jgi:hypothetical protein